MMVLDETLGYHDAWNGGRKFDVERHNGGNGFNAVFCDAHVEYFPSVEFIGGSEPENEAAVLEFFLGQ